MTPMSSAAQSPRRGRAQAKPSGKLAAREVAVQAADNLRDWLSNDAPDEMFGTGSRDLEALQALILAAEAGKMTDRVKGDLGKMDAPRLDALQMAVALRITRAFKALLQNVPEPLLLRALSSSTDIRALSSFVSDMQFADANALQDPLAGPIARSIEHREKLKEMAGEMLSSAQVEKYLGISRQAVDKRRKSGHLLGLRIGSDWAYPALQFDKGDTSKLMRKVLATYSESDPWVVLDTLLAKDDALGGQSLLDAIRKNDASLVERHLRQLGRDGFA